MAGIVSSKTGDNSGYFSLYWQWNIDSKTLPVFVDSNEWCTTMMNDADYKN